MLCALIVMGYGGFGLLRHGHTTLPAYREHLNYRGMSFKRNRVSPYRSLQGEDQPQGGSMAVRVSELRESERCPVIGQTEVASPRWDNITSPETELTSRWCSNSRPFVEAPMQEAKQMTIAQAAGAASHTLVVSPLPCELAADQYRVGCIHLLVNKAASSFFTWAFLECSSRMRRKSHVRFLEGWPPAMGAGHSAHRQLTAQGLAPC
jgi:hypothetical protein